MGSIALTLLLLTLSNVFMTVAWYGHLRFMSSPLWVAVLASWGVAFFEYCLQVPANRIGYGAFQVYHLKTIQEIITLTVFVVFAQVYFGEGLRPKHVAGFALLVIAAWFVFQEQYGMEW